MELWIRSQDKSNLKKVNNIYVEEITKDYDSWVGNIYSQPYVITSDEGNLGFYATKERALEVLDEIQKQIYNYGKSFIETDDNGIPSNLKYYSNVYEMPKE